MKDKSLRYLSRLRKQIEWIICTTMSSFRIIHLGSPPAVGCQHTLFSYRGMSDHMCEMGTALVRGNVLQILQDISSTKSISLLPCVFQSKCCILPGGMRDSQSSADAKH